MGFVTRRTFPLLERHMDMRVLQPLAQGLMTIPAQVFLVLDQKLWIFTAVRAMTIGAYSLPDRIVHEFFIQRISHFFMTAETEGGGILFHQTLQISRMGIMTGCAFPFLEGEMNLLPEQLVLHF